MLSNLHRGDGCSHSHDPMPVVHAKVDFCKFWPWEICAAQLGEAPVLTAFLPYNIHYYIQVGLCSDSNVLNRHMWHDEDFSGFNLLLSPVWFHFQWLLLWKVCPSVSALMAPSDSRGGVFVASRWRVCMSAWTAAVAAAAAAAGLQTARPITQQKTAVTHMERDAHKFQHWI